MRGTSGSHRLRHVGLVVLLAGTLGACTEATSMAPATSAPSEPATAVPSESQSLAPTSEPDVGGLPGEPDRTLTPGAVNPSVTRATIGSTICVSGWTATVRPPSSYTTSLKRAQIVSYGYADTNLADYEEDHLIPLEVGGAPSDPRNLWPEPYTSSLADGTPDGARVKDQLENKFKALVCAGALPLETAQREIATDWVRTWFALIGDVVPGTATAAPAEQAGGGGVAPMLQVAIASLTSPVRAGSSATLHARTVPGAACSIVVIYKSGPSSAKGLVAKTADSAGAVAWTWTVGSRTTPGSWSVIVSCSSGGSTGSAQATLVVT